MKSNWILIGSAMGLAIILTLSHALLRAAATYVPLEVPWLTRVGAALFLYALVFFVYTLLLKHFDISILYPAYTALSILGVTLVGIVYFGESYTFYKMFGMVLLVVGIGLVTS